MNESKILTELEDGLIKAVKNSFLEFDGFVYDAIKYLYLEFDEEVKVLDLLHSLAWENQSEVINHVFRTLEKYQENQHNGTAIRKESKILSLMKKASDEIDSYQSFVEENIINNYLNGFIIPLSPFDIIKKKRIIDTLERESYNVRLQLLNQISNLFEEYEYLLIGIK